MSENDQKVIALLRQVGLNVGLRDQYFEPALVKQEGFFVNRIRPAISSTAGDYLAIKFLQPHSLSSDTRTSLRFDDVVLWASEWEKYLSANVQNPSDAYIQDAARRYWLMLEYLLISESEGSVGFSAFEDGKLDEYSARVFQDAIRQYPDSKMTAMILSLLDAIAANGNRLSPAVKKTLSDKIAAGFQADARLSAPTEAMLLAEKKLLGKHGFSNNGRAVRDKKMDVAVISRKPTGLHINAIQRKDRLSISLNGAVTVISDKEFTVFGVIEMIQPMNEGDDYFFVCHGTFTFKATDTSAYWRMQNTESCKHEEGDLDVLFADANAAESDANSEVEAQWIEKKFVILKSTKNYKEALKTAQSASQLLDVKIDLRGLSENKESGLTLSKEVCEKEEGGVADGYPCYYARGRENDATFISIEYSSAFQGFSKGYYIVVLASHPKDDKAVLASLKKAKKHYPDAYAKISKVYMGCLH